MPDRPALEVINESNLDQRHADGGTDLPPGIAIVVRDNDEPSFTDWWPARATLNMTDWAAMALAIDGCTGNPSVCAEAVPVSAATIDTLSMNAFNGCLCKCLGV
jgi:hypothetical protein